MDVLKIVDHYGLLDKDTRVFDDSIKIPCPFHHESQPSLNISLTKEMFHCFGCGAKGNMVDFVSRIEDETKIKSLVILNKIHKGNMSKRPSYLKDYADMKVDKAKLKKESLFFFKSLPKQDWFSLEKDIFYKHKVYMFDRGYTPEILEKFSIKINPAGLYPIIVPLIEQGVYTGYIMRRVDKEEPKYLYSKGYVKREALVGNLKPGVVMIVEGVMDLMKTYQNGFKNVCALSGWKASAEQIKKIKKVTNKVICGLDNTPTGGDGYEILKEHFSVKRFVFPEGGAKDLGDLDRHQFEKCLRDTLKITKR